MAAPKLKDLFDEALIRELADELAQAVPGFDAPSFARSSLDGLDALELTGRAWRIAEALREHLPQPFPRAADALVASLGPELARSDAFGLSPLRYMPHVF